jgi:membrane protein
MRPAGRAASWLGELARAVFGRVFAHGVTSQASLFAYNAFLATIPFLFVMVAVIGLVASPATYRQVIAGYGDSIPDELRTILLASLRQAAEGSQALLFLVLGVVGGLYLASNAIGALMTGLDRAYGAPHRPWLRGKLVALGFAAAASVLAAGSALAALAGPRVLVELLRLMGADEDAGRIAAESISWFVNGALVVFVVLLYRFGPNVRCRLLAILPGAIVAAAGWVGAIRLFRLYVDHFGSYNKVYGSLGAVVVYMTFLYLTGLMLFIGAELNGELASRRGDDLCPAPADAAPSGGASAA